MSVRVANIVVDIPARALSEPFDYLVPEDLDKVAVVGAPVVVPFGHRMCAGYVVGRCADSDLPELKEIAAVAGEPLFDETGALMARWIAREYLSTLADAFRLLLPPGAAPSVQPGPEGGWRLRRRGVSAVDDRWAELIEDAAFRPAANATLQRAVLDALAEGPVPVRELREALGGVDGAVKRLQEAGAVTITHRRRIRGGGGPARPVGRPDRLSDGQTASLRSIRQGLERRAGTFVLDGVTGSGKTEVYLRAIEDVLAEGGGAIVLVPEISLTPQTVGRFRARFGETVAVLHSRLSAGERFDQWELAARGEARVVVGARSAVFAPVRDLRLIVIDEEHEHSYKQGSAPRYDARTVARRVCDRRGAVLVLGSATPRLETLEWCREGAAVRLELPERVTGRPLPDVEVVDMAAEFAEGHRSMFSRTLLAALEEVRERRDKAVVLLNRRGFASFLLCRECGFVPSCESCSTSLTLHETGTATLRCHHCGRRETVPPLCPKCGSAYLRRFGAGTQRVEAELAERVPGLPVVRMDADTTARKGGHERRIAEFETLEYGVLLGTQMIAKGLDYPDVTLAAVVNADTTLHLPDFRSGERTWQLLEQVSGRAGRGTRQGRVVVQTYWPEHPAIVAVAAHDRRPLLDAERADRSALGYPPFRRLGNVLVSGPVENEVAAVSARVAGSLRPTLPPGWEVVGPAPSPLSRLKGAFRWHLLLKAPPDADIASVLAPVLAARHPEDVRVVADVDPADLL